MRDERLRRLGEFAYGLTPQKRQPFEAQGAQDRRTPKFLVGDYGVGTTCWEVLYTTDGSC